MEKTLAKLGNFIGNQSIGTTFSLPFAIKSFQRHCFQCRRFCWQGRNSVSNTTVFADKEETLFLASQILLAKKRHRF